MSRLATEMDGLSPPFVHARNTLFHLSQDFRTYLETEYNHILVSE